MITSTDQTINKHIIEVLQSMQHKVQDHVSPEMLAGERGHTVNKSVTLTVLQSKKCIQKS